MEPNNDPMLDNTMCVFVWDASRQYRQKNNNLNDTQLHTITLSLLLAPSLSGQNYSFTLYKMKIYLNKISTMLQSAKIMLSGPIWRNRKNFISPDSDFAPQYSEGFLNASAARERFFPPRRASCCINCVCARAAERAGLRRASRTCVKRVGARTLSGGCELKVTTFVGKSVASIQLFLVLLLHERLCSRVGFCTFVKSLTVSAVPKLVWRNICI